MKTLDYQNFFKSQDASQILYVHDKKLENFKTYSKEEMEKVI